MSTTERVWTVADVMVEDVVTVSPSTPFKQLIDLLWLNEVSALPVVDEHGAPVGMVTESDLLVRSQFDPTARGRDHGRSRREELYRKLDKAEPLVASDVMSSPVVTLAPGQTLADAARLMRSRHLRRLPVLDAAGALVGMVSQVDLLKVFFRSEETVEWDVRDVLRRRLGNTTRVGVHVADGVVHLQGLAPAAPDTDRLVAAVDSVPGVVAVEIS